MFKSHSGGAGFKGMKEPWSAAEVWHREKPSKAKGKRTALAVIEAPGLKGSWRVAETWHTWLVCQGRVPEESLEEGFDEGAAQLQ